MRHPRSDAEASPRIVAWTFSCILWAPLALWLLVAKAIALGSASVRYFVGGPTSESLLGSMQWLAHFAWVRVAVLALVSYLAYRIFFRKRPLLGLLVFAGLVLCLAGVMSTIKQNHSFLGFLSEGAQLLWGQVILFGKSAWREVITVSVLALVTAFILHACPLGLRKFLVRTIQVLVLLLCVLVGLDLVSELSMGQPINSHVLWFSFSNWNDLTPLVLSETTPLRIAILALGILLPAGWAWHNRKLAGGTTRHQFSSNTSRWGLALAAAGACAAFFPTFSIGMMPMERFTEGALIAFAKTVASTESLQANRKVDREFEAQGRPRWHSAAMKLVKTETTRRKNVVVVMMESMRASSTTIHAPTLPSTPFLAKLAGSSLVVEDMSAIVPRTAGAWMAVLGGQFPLTNEGAARWNAENTRTQRIRGLPAALRMEGYATSFFTPANLKFLDDREVIKALGFETIVGSEDLSSEMVATPINYMGLADDVMVEPVLAWTASQVKNGRPFMTAIMTNVGHHPYSVPPSWKTVKFAGVSEPSLEAYLNCLLYIDGIVASLMSGYQRLGILDETIFVFLGDHGQFLGEHGIKQVFNALYQEGLHVPALIHAPGLGLSHGMVRGPRQQVDVLPTIVDLLGYRVEGARLPGTSLLQPVDADRQLFFSSSMESTFLASRRGSRKYIYSFGRSPVEVFELPDDPKEANPIAGVPNEELAMVERAMLEWRAAAELSMFARPLKSAEATEPWLRR